MNRRASQGFPGIRYRKRSCFIYFIRSSTEVFKAAGLIAWFKIAIRQKKVSHYPSGEVYFKVVLLGWDSYLPSMGGKYRNPTDLMLSTILLR